MKKIFLAIMMAFAISLCAQTPQENREALVKYVEQLNKECPQNVLGIVTQTGIALQGNNLVFNWIIVDDNAYEQIKGKKDLLKEAKIAELSTSGGTDPLVKFVDMFDVNLVFNMVNNSRTDSLELKITKADLQ